MKRARKLVALLVALTFLFSLAVPAMAADADDTSAEALRLQALGIVTGYEDGSFRLDNTITRAEFAAITVRALGLEDAAKTAMGTTQFSDVEANKWYTGYINIAAQYGIVNGYPDGTFKPAKDVSYAEAVKMIVASLGYAPVVKGQWPTNFLAKAAELGITKGVSFSFNDPAPRGDVFKFVDKSLTVDLMEQVGYGDTATYEIKEGKTLLTDKLDAEEVEGVVVDVPALLGSDLDDNEIVIDVDGTETTYEVTAGVETADLIGLEVTVLVNDDDEVFFVKETNADDVIEDTIDAVVDGTSVTLDDAEETYTLTASSIVVINFVAKNFDKDDVTTTYEGADVKVLVNSDDEIEFIQITDWPDPIVVDEVDADDKEISAKANSVGSIDGDYDNDDYEVAIEKNGEAIDFADIEENDLVYQFKYNGTGDNDDYLLVVVSDKVSGELEAASSDWDEVKIDGAKYDAALALKSTDDGDTFSAASTASDLLGEEVTALLDYKGDVYALAADIVAENANVAVVVEDDGAETYKGETTFYVKVFTETGEEVIYDFDGDEYDAEPGLTSGQIIGFDLNADGLIKSHEVKSTTPGSIDFAVETEKDNAEDYDRIKIGTKWYYVTDDTVIIDATAGYDDAELIAWDTFVADASGAFDFDAVIDGSEFEYIVLLDTSTGTIAGESDYVVYVGADFVADGINYTFFEGGELVTVLDEDATSVDADVYEYAIVEYTTDNDGYVTDITLADSVVEGAITDIDSGLKVITVGSNDYLVTADTVIVSTIDDELEEVTFSDLAEEDNVRIQLDGDIAEFIVIYE